MVSLHHVEPFEDSCRRLAEVVRPGGTLVVDEFDVDRFDERRPRWLLERWRETGQERDRPTRPRWWPSSSAHLHPLDAIRDALGEWFELGPVARASYLYRWYLGEEFRAAEEALIADGSTAGARRAVRGTRRDG